MSKSKKLVFFGTDEFSAAFLERLLDDDRLSINAVITKSPSRKGRHSELTPSAVETLAKQRGVEHILHADNKSQLDEIAGRIKNLLESDELYGVLVSFGVIISPTSLSQFEAIVNLHPSLLPKYRGPSPIEAAILNGDEQTGISIMKLIEKMDAGPIYAQKELALSQDETSASLRQKVVEQGADFLADTLVDVLNDKVTPTPQNDEQASYCSVLKKSDGHMDLEHKEAAKLQQEVRAYVGFPKSRLSYEDFELIVTAARVADSENDGAFVVPCAKNTFLEITQLIAPSGRRMSGADYLRGYKKS